MRNARTSQVASRCSRLRPGPSAAASVATPETSSASRADKRIQPPRVPHDDRRSTGCKANGNRYRRHQRHRHRRDVEPRDASRLAAHDEREQARDKRRRQQHQNENHIHMSSLNPVDVS